MAERTKQLAVAVSPREKETIRQAAAARGQSMSSFMREEVLDGLPLDAPPVLDHTGNRPPLDDFKTARLNVDSDANPVPKRDVYESYVAFCEDQYPNHKPESQHKVSREIAALDGVGTGRRYVTDESGELTQERCFLNLRRVDQSQPDSPVFRRS